ncbi:hypothetical protein Hanom_Chr07g00605581 [Helianthus anomalus]
MKSVVNGAWLARMKISGCTLRATKLQILKRIEDLKKSESDYKDKYEEAKSYHECVEVLQVELSQQIITKDKDLAGKDVETAELQRRLREAQDNL